MGQVVNTMLIEQRVHIAAHHPIHKMFYQLVPVLESRQRAAQAYQQVSLNTEKLDMYLDIIREHEKQIFEILGMQNPVV